MALTYLGLAVCLVFLFRHLIRRSNRKPLRFDDKEKPEKEDTKDAWEHAFDLDESARIQREALRQNKPARLDTSRWSLELLRALEWKRFEIVCAAYFESIGFRARTARAGPDGGVDIHLYADGATTPGIIVQCKAWNAYKIGIKPIRELFGVMAKEKIAEGIFVTTSQFTSEALSFPEGDELHLWDGSELLRKISELPDDKKNVLLRVATEGDFTTPTCPSCAVKMVSRTNKKNGEQFWGCRNYPKCRQRFSMTQANATSWQNST